VNPCVHVQRGSYVARFDKDGFVSFELPLDESFRVGSENKPASAKVKLVPLAQVHGRVLTPDGAPAANAQVEMVRSFKDPELLSTVTNSEGEFGFDRVLPGSFDLRAVPKMESAGVEKADAAEGEVAVSKRVFALQDELSRQCFSLAGGQRRL
jgi:hypothetical protein